MTLSLVNTHDPWRAPGEKHPSNMKVENAETLLIIGIAASTTQYHIRSHDVFVFTSYILEKYAVGKTQISFLVRASGEALASYPLRILYRTN